MSDWKPKQGPASFRAVKFFIDMGERTGGRSSVPHVYPGSEKPPFHDDMGLKSRAFTVDGYVNGTEYETARDNLIKALETPGPGELIHPYFTSPRRCVAKEFTTKQSFDDGGVCRFSINFEETSLEPNPVATTAGPSAVTNVAAIATVGIKQQFIDKFKPAAQLKESVAGALTNAGSAVQGVVDTVSLPTQAAASLTNQVQSLKDSANSLASAPESISTAITTLITTLADAVILANSISPHGILLRIAGFDAGVRPPATTDARADEQNNFDATTGLIKRVALVKSAELIATEKFDSFDEAVLARDNLVQAFEDHLESANTDDVAFVALVDLRTALVSAVPGDGSDLPRLLEHTPATPTNSLVLAHRLYGNLDLELDLVARNHVRHPGYLLPGVTLEVLSK